ncbi:hypothetical protein REJC140_00375 [Pseudorhizobium endolithicum]|uniref:DUF930 domain-containing protein n=1 Tax=Pseudorhizobium endolithicum TaxID=1191678 RepID=A0ABM8PDW5_9HYPH|nr:DUF930 domain-containing protein [Pseudorhizobium endolithicum]CAD7023929.1 hypothetical protein REJC140_00375 [Pseudorhizobium endolithicum]
MRWGIPMSVAAHAVVAVILIFGLPIELPSPPEEEVVAVEIIEPPPEPEPEAEEEEEMPPAEEAPAPPPPAEEQPAEPPPPPPEAETPAEEEEAAAPPIPTLRPVFEFGEETTGPRNAPGGNSSKEAGQAPAEEEPDASASAPPDAPEPLTVAPQEDPETAEAASAPPETLEDATETEEQPTEEPLDELAEAKTLFSPDMTEDPVARTAMDGMPRAMRATQLCETELTEQLRNASPPQDPDFIPRSPLSEGTVLELRRTAFRAEEQWYDLSFRCEINEDATKVVSFAFSIGAPVPRSEWRRRGFPGS